MVASSFKKVQYITWKIIIPVVKREGKAIANLKFWVALDVYKHHCRVKLNVP